jgi:hypothetical protein
MVQQLLLVLQKALSLHYICSSSSNSRQVGKMARQLEIQGLSHGKQEQQQ